MIDLIINNYQWFFSGLGVFLLSIVIGFIIRRQMRKRATIKNIRIGSKTQVNIIQSEGNVQISYPNLKDISSEQILAGLLEVEHPEILKLETKLARGKEIYDPEEMKAMEYNQRAIQLARGGKYNEGLINIRKAIDINPEEEFYYKENLVAITENYATSLAFDNGLFDEAITLMEELKEEGLLNDGNGYWILGYVYYKKKLYEQAISAYQQAIIFEPKNYLHHLYLSDAYSYKGIKDNDLNYQEKALKEVGLSLKLNPQQIIINDYPYTSFAEIILLNALIEITKCNAEQIKTEYKDFLIRIGYYSSNQIDELTKEWRIPFIKAAVAIARLRSTVEEKIGSRVDFDTLIHGVKTIEEIQAIVKETTNKEIPIPALLKLLQINQVNEKEKMELAIDLIQCFGEDETVVFARELDKTLKKRKRWIIIHQPERG
ncbi:MAG: tetratricopeptide repeat protein [Candidatus Cloacimonetes bacterium]|nr:tetratricopeptide repeat protein [Candidatus Cloacimonadota bacterium]